MWYSISSHGKIYFFCFDTSGSENVLDHLSSLIVFFFKRLKKELKIVLFVKLQQNEENSHFSYRNGVTFVCNSTGKIMFSCGFEAMMFSKNHIITVIDRYASPMWPLHRSLTLSLFVLVISYVTLLLLYKIFSVKERRGREFADNTRHHRAEMHRQPISQFRHTYDFLEA
jgi:hypothetical protein